MKKIVYFAVCVSFLFVSSLQAQGVPSIELKGDYAIWSAAFSQDGKKVVTGCGDRSVRIWDAASGKELQKLDGQPTIVTSAFFSPDGKKIVTLGHFDSVVRILDAESGKELHKLNGRSADIFSPDGKKIITVSSDGSARILNAESKQELRKWEGRVQFAAFSSDGKKIITTDSDTARILDAESGRELQRLKVENYANEFQFAAFSPDGKKIVTVGMGNVRIWDVESGKELQRLEGSRGGAPYSANSAAFSPDGKRIITGGHSGIWIWDAESGRVLLVFEGSGLLPHFSSDGKKIVMTRNSTAQIVDISALPQQWAEAQKRFETEQKAGFLDLGMESRKSGFGLTDLHEFVYCGTSALRDSLRQADAFGRADTETKMKAIRAETAKKKFYSEYAYSAPDHKVRVEGDKTSFVMEIPTEFAVSKIDAVLFPSPGMTGRLDSDQVAVHMGRGMVLTVNGSTDGVRELVRNSGNYHARVWFTNLRLEERNGVLADVLKIEVIKVQ